MKSVMQGFCHNRIRLGTYLLLVQQDFHGNVIDYMPVRTLSQNKSVLHLAPILDDNILKCDMNMCDFKMIASLGSHCENLIINWLTRVTPFIAREQQTDLHAHACNMHHDGFNCQSYLVVCGKNKTDNASDEKHVHHQHPAHMHCQNTILFNSLWYEHLLSIKCRSATQERRSTKSMLSFDSRWGSKKHGEFERLTIWFPFQDSMSNEIFCIWISCHRFLTTEVWNTVQMLAIVKNRLP